MALSEYALSEEPIGSDEVGSFSGNLDYWVVLNGTLESRIQIDSINIEDTQGGNSTARFKLLNPSRFPRAGHSVVIVWQDEQLFGGQLVTVTLDMEQDETVKVFSCEAIGWMRILERRIVTAQYASANFANIMNTVLGSTLAGEGIRVGTIDAGPELVLAKADHIRVSEFLRDTAEASGGIVYIDPYKRLQFRKATIDAAPFLLTNSDVEYVSSEEDLDQYRNRQHVQVTGTGGASVSVQREDSTEIAARVALEGGTGIYEAHDSIEHPTSNNALDLERLGISYSIVKLAATARVRRLFRARISRPRLRLGQVVSVDLPAYELAGNWQITRLRTWDEGGTLRFQFEAQLTNFQQLALESLLNIVGAGRATVVLPVNEFAGLDTITSSGTYTVPGTSGNVELEITAYGPGGGGGGAYWEFAGRLGLIWKVGFVGQPGGKAVAFRSYPAGTVLTITIGQGGAGGTNLSDDPDGFYPNTPIPPGSIGQGPTRVDLSGVLVAEGLPGGGGYASEGPGDATGDYRFPGDGAAGGAGGVYGTSNGASGSNGWVEIRY